MEIFKKSWMEVPFIDSQMEFILKKLSKFQLGIDPQSVVHNVLCADGLRRCSEKRAFFTDGCIDFLFMTFSSEIHSHIDCFHVI